MSAPAPLSPIETVDVAWDHIQAAFAESDPARMAEAWQLFGSIERPAQGSDDTPFFLGRMAVAHAPIFDAMMQGGEVGPDELAAVRRNLANDVITPALAPSPDEDEPDIADLQPGAMNALRRAVVSALLSRRDTPDGIYVAYPAPAFMGIRKFMDEEGMGWRHLMTQTPFDGDPNVPIRIAAATRAAGVHQEGGHKEQDGIMYVGIGQLMLAVAKESPFNPYYQQVARDRGILARDIITADVAALLAREAQQDSELSADDYAFLDTLSDVLITQTQDYADQRNPKAPIN